MDMTELIAWARKAAGWARALANDARQDPDNKAAHSAEMLDAIADRLEAVMWREAQR